MGKRVVRCALKDDKPIFETECPVILRTVKPNSNCRKCNFNPDFIPTATSRKSVTHTKKIRPNREIKQEKENLGKKEFSEMLKEVASYPQSHLLDYHETSGIQILFPDPSHPGFFNPWQLEDYLKKKEYAWPFRFIDAIDEGNCIRVSIHLDHKRKRLQDNLSRLITIGRAELKKHKRKRFKIRSADFERLLKIRKLEEEGLKGAKMAEEFSPKLFDGRLYGQKIEAAIKRTSRARKRLKKMIEGK